MAQTQTTTAVILYIFFNIFTLVILPSTSSNFTLKLTHIDSPLSPLYQSNLTDLQRLTKHAQISTARASYFQLTDNQNKAIRLPVKYQEPIFTVEVAIGTPSVKKTLMFDTASHLTWTQCTPCRKCFMQHEPYFDPTESSSYKLMPKKHPLAKALCSLFGKCSYNIRYIFGGFSSGDVAMESFTFQSDGGNHIKVPNLVFGCGRNSAGHFPMQISGILGFNREPSSFSRQLGAFINGRFSYCLPPYAGAGASYVRFGDDAVARGRNAQRTPLLKTNRRMYGLNLLDISINGQKLGLGKSAFSKGCYVDSGAYFSSLNRRAFSAATTFLDKYFSQFRDVKRYEGESAPRSMNCYTMPVGFGSFPSMTFHFQGADYRVPHQSLFPPMKGRGGSLFCFLMVESKDATILGAYQQRNVRMVYDLKEGMLSFAQEDCSRDGA